MKISRRKSRTPIDPIAQLNAINPWRKDIAQRIEMTISCHDCDYIPKVKYAGNVEVCKGKEVQILHNGLKVISGGYHGDWMKEIITKLNGHHEPQEEKLYYEVLKRLKGAPTILELGSFWSYYSLWLLYQFKNSRALACEPDPVNRKIGEANAAINGLADRITFIDSAAGNEDGKKIEFTLDSDPSQKKQSIIRSVDSLVKEKHIKKIDILHMDVQGVELNALQGAIESIKEDKVRFIFISTHHYTFSHDPMTHQKCKQFLLDNGAYIISSHNILESFSGDGLIVASFDKRDKDFKVDVSLNHSDNSLFRPYEEDIALMIGIAQEAANK
ncbi:FkbM family methyltransferase [Candidatus Saccharibacteria bacterium]|nr:FkbM family methyltransferase [Candidatus Saccharibacteria bacterium]MBI3337895.1 FkbM family methyltransferase [Candidatus Saccharibacteria bacterium]